MILTFVGVTVFSNDAQAVNGSVSLAAKDVAWPWHGGDKKEQRFSPLSQVNRANVQKLGLHWSLDFPDARGQEATPLIIGSVMYTTAAWSVVYALDAKSGKLIWKYDPKVDKSWAVNGCCDAVNRGVAYWQGKVYVGTLDGRLVAIDAKTGRLQWETLTIDKRYPYTITGAPRVANNKVFIGNGGAEFGVRGYVSAYDAKSGEQVWRFYTVPGKPDKPQENKIHEEAIKTWDGKWWELGGGGTVWDSMVYDEELNRLYIGVGNGSPWNPQLRSNGKGDNLFLSSIVALDADSGEYIWHYQTTPQEGWDYTATQHMILAELNIDGRLRKVIMQAPKNGFFYVLDRVSGEFISGKNFVPVSWASHIDQKTGRPVINPAAKYWETGKVVMQSPAFLGGHNWHPMSYSKKTGLVYLPAQEMSFPYQADKAFVKKKLAANLGVDTSAARLPDDKAVIDAVKKATRGHLAAWDPVQQKEVWRVQYPGPWNGGVLSTAGDLVFQGTASGFFRAYDATTGEQLWEFAAQSGIVAPPVSYQLDGEQYISVMVGWGGIYPLITGPLSQASGQVINKSRLLTFKLGSNKQLPSTQTLTSQLPDTGKFALKPADIEKGFKVYDRYCGACHGAGAVGGGVVPDLRFSTAINNTDLWSGIVRDGLLSSRGMVAFGAEVSVEDAESIRHYVINRNRFARKVNELQRIGR